jgi:hypothetical protein
LVASGITNANIANHINYKMKTCKYPALHKTDWSEISFMFSFRKKKPNSNTRKASNVSIVN